MNFDLKLKKHASQDDEFQPAKKRTKIAYETHDSANDNDNNKPFKNDYQKLLFIVKHVKYIDNNLELQLVNYFTGKEVKCLLNDSW
jgi:hypothetical protein